jgi:hypothetical protein
MNRRDVLRLSTRLALASTFAPWLRARAEAVGPTAAVDPKRVSAVIVLWMNGGPSHVDTWDPKPGSEVAGPFKAIDTAIPGARINEHLPRLAAQGKRLAILRGLSTREGNHDRARHLVHTGYSPTPTVAHPAFGGWMSEELGDPNAELPSFVSIGGPSAPAGFLGVQYNPFVVRTATKPPQNVERPRNVDEQRFGRREKALASLEDGFAAQTGDAKVSGRREVFAKAVRMMRSAKMKAFDLSEEPAATVASYGDSDFGKGCLLARRLVENGVRYVEVQLDGWDTHQDNFTKTAKLMEALDPGFAGLLDDLAARQMLDRTLVLCLGEFGRTPKINDREGRDHHPNAWSAVLAGGGLRTGQVVGETDARAEKVVKRPITMPDLFATLALRVGLNPDKTMTTPLGRPLSITDSGKPLAELMPT